MPNVKFYVDGRHFAALKAPLEARFAGLRSALCAALNVPPAACQIVAVEAWGLPDQPQINIEIFLLPAEARTPEMLRALGQTLKADFSALSGLSVAVRLHALDPATYIALK